MPTQPDPRPYTEDDLKLVAQLIAAREWHEVLSEDGKVIWVGEDLYVTAECILGALGAAGRLLPPPADPDALRSTTDHASALSEARTRVVEASRALARRDLIAGAAEWAELRSALAAVDALEEVERR